MPVRAFVCCGLIPGSCLCVYSRVARAGGEDRYLDGMLKSPKSDKRAHLGYTSLETVGVVDHADLKYTPRKVVLVYTSSGLGSLPPKLEQNWYRK